MGHPSIKDHRSGPFILRSGPRPHLRKNLAPQTQCDKQVLVIHLDGIKKGWPAKSKRRMKISSKPEKFMNLPNHNADTLSTAAMIIAWIMGGIQQALASACKACFGEHQIIALRIESNIR
jgi:hypothetical protein